MKTLKFLALISLVTFTLAACNTVEGVGEDVKAGGAAIDKSAERNKTY